MKIIGVNFHGHDSALVSLDFKSRTIFAISTERVTRIKHDGMDISPILKHHNQKDAKLCCVPFNRFSYNADLTPLSQNHLHQLYIEKIRRTICGPRYRHNLYEQASKQIIIKYAILNPFKAFYFKFHKQLYFIQKPSPSENKFLIKKTITKHIKKILNSKRIDVDYYDHHLCHNIAAYFSSNFQNASAISVSLDGRGDGFFSKVFIFKGKDYKLLSESKTPLILYKNIKTEGSLGIVYTNFTSALGFYPNSDEGKVEALAAYGKSNTRLYNLLGEAIECHDCRLEVNQKAIYKFYDSEWLKNELNEIGKHDFAATIQYFLENTVLLYLSMIKDRNPTIENLCLSGGVFANVILNFKIFNSELFKNIYVLPAMGDEGAALGSSILGAIKKKLDVSWIAKQKMPYWGNEITKSEIISCLTKHKSIINKEFIGSNWPVKAAKLICSNKIIAIVQGKMEFGPRALGNRSIIASAFDPAVKEKLNKCVKKRNEFQPFCPTVLEGERERLFEKSYSNKHMTMAFMLKEQYRSSLPGGIHIDGTARPQFIDKSDNQKFHELLVEVKKISSFGFVINTSFNLHGRTMVRTAEDAVIDFIDCKLDYMIIGNYLVSKKI